MSEPNQKGLKLPSFPARHRRRPPAVDMLPYAGVAFILLSAFTVASEMRHPRLMEIAVPPSLCDMYLPEWYRPLTIYIRHDDRLFMMYGNDPVIYPADLSRLREWAAARMVARQNLLVSDGNDKLLVTIAADGRATYARVVDVLEDLNLAMDDARTSTGSEYLRGVVASIGVFGMSEDDQQRMEKL